MPTINKGYEPAELLCRIFLAFKGNHVFIDNIRDFVEILKRMSNVPPYLTMFGRVNFQSEGAKITAPEIEASFEEMKEFMIFQDEHIPEKWNFDRKEMQDYASKFSDAGVDPRVLKKLADKLESKIGRQWEFKLLKRGNPQLGRPSSPPMPEENKEEEDGETVQNKEFGEAT